VIVIEKQNMMTEDIFNIKQKTKPQIDDINKMYYTKPVTGIQKQLCLQHFI